MTKFMTMETPAKIFSMLGIAVSSLFFLFAVTMTNANFHQTEKSFPAVFNPDTLVAELDSGASAYGKFVSENLIQPQQQSYAVLGDAVNYIIDEAGPSILAYTGTAAFAQNVGTAAPLAQPRVAGASTLAVVSQYYQSQGQGFNIDGLYHFLIR